MLRFHAMREVSLVMPCYNEEKRLPQSLILDYLSSHPHVAILLVNDGSVDKTGALIDHLSAENPSQIRTLHLEKNCGKAEAVRRGMLALYEQAPGPWFGFWDADLAMPMGDVDRLLNNADTDDVKMAMCSRLKCLGAFVERPLWRHLASRVMAALIAMTLRLPVYDTQCGGKLIRRDIVPYVFGRPFLSRWLFDVEILARMLQRDPNIAQNRSVIEVPVSSCLNVPGSKIKKRHFVGALVDIVRIYRAYRFGRHSKDAANVYPLVGSPFVQAQPSPDTQPVSRRILQSLPDGAGTKFQAKKPSRSEENISF
jgi:glycosyltransferase involved in cell wall biosynthesis